MKAVIIIFSVILVAFIAFQLWAMNGQKDIETYQYTVEKSYDDFEIRKYEETLFTTVTLDKNTYDESSSKGFGILAGYIFGGNDQNEKIAMTSPVAMSMDDQMTMMFMVPKEFDRESLPVPNDSQIQFTEMPAKTVAAISFGGWANDEKIENYKNQLTSALDREGIQYTDVWYFLGYNAPYELVNRKNDVIIELVADEL